MLFGIRSDQLTQRCMTGMFEDIHWDPECLSPRRFYLFVPFPFDLIADLHMEQAEVSLQGFGEICQEFQHPLIRDLRQIRTYQYVADLGWENRMLRDA